MSTPVLRPLSLGEVLDVSFGLYRSRFAPLLVVSVVCQVVPSLLRIYFGSGNLTSLGSIPVLLAYYTLAIVLSAVGVSASTFIVSDAYLGQETSASDALGRAIAMIGRIIAVSIMSSFLIGIGFILLIIPGIILLSGLILSTVVAVIEGKANSAALGRSWELTKGFRGKVLLTMCCIFLLLMVPTITVSAIWAIIGVATGGIGLIGTEILTSLISILIYPFFYVVLTVLYYDLRVRKEGFDLELLSSQLATG